MLTSFLVVGRHPRRFTSRSSTPGDHCGRRLPWPVRSGLCVEPVSPPPPQHQARTLIFSIINSFTPHLTNSFVFRTSGNLSWRLALTPLKSISIPRQIAPNPFRIRSYMISADNSFRIRSSKNNRGEGLLWLTRFPKREPFAREGAGQRNACSYPVVS